MGEELNTGGCPCFKLPGVLSAGFLVTDLLFKMLTHRWLVLAALLWISPVYATLKRTNVASIQPYKRELLQDIVRKNTSDPKKRLIQW
jgi:hypothetical protein